VFQDLLRVVVENGTADSIPPEGCADHLFYIDVQTFGKDFACFYHNARKNITMIRAIPGDIMRTGTDELEVIYFSPETNTSTEALFDVVVLSVGAASVGGQ
jgi:heterodisulfide reductase subunit A-like polyferredoxin